MHFFEERLCKRAQWEIRSVAEKMLDLVKDACPALFAGCGPRCVRHGRCTEGKMSCGQYTEIRAKYGDDAGCSQGSAEES